MRRRTPRESRQGRRPAPRRAPPPLGVAPTSNRTARVTLYMFATCGGRCTRLQLEAEIQVVLRAVLVESPRLVLVQGIVLERRIVQVHAVESDREVLVHRVPQRRRQGPDGVLSERRA